MAAASSSGVAGVPTVLSSVTGNWIGSDSDHHRYAHS